MAYHNKEELLIAICTLIWGSYGGSPAPTVKKLKDILGLGLEKESEETMGGYPIDKSGKKPEPKKESCYHRHATVNFKEHVICQRCDQIVSEPKQGEWCSHCELKDDRATVHWRNKMCTDFISAFDEMLFCPICGTPRPSVPSIREGLIDKLREPICYLLPDPSYPSTHKTGRLTTGCATELAAIAIAFMGEKK